MPDFGPYHISKNNKQKINTTLTNTINNDNTTFIENFNNTIKQDIVISPYLNKHMQLWLWDWDDTLLDTRAYHRHSMNSNYIEYHLTDEELLLDIPNYQYFKDLVYYLVEKGIRVGIVSFGIYSIIRSYMNRIFGMNQKIFTHVNIYASCQEIGQHRDYHKIPINKNVYIQKIMNHYKLNNYSNVVLFDDNSTNIADALRLGVFAIQIILPIQEDKRDNIDMSSILFGEKIMFDLESKLQYNNTLPTEFNFGYLGDRKYWKRRTQEEYEMMKKELIPNFMNEGFQPDVPLNAPKPKPYHNLFKGKDTIVEGFYNQEVGVYPSSCNINKDNEIKEGFSQCMDCQNPMSNYVVGVIFTLMIITLVLFVYYG